MKVVVVERDVSEDGLGVAFVAPCCHTSSQMRVTWGGVARRKLRLSHLLVCVAAVDCTVLGSNLLLQTRHTGLLSKRRRRVVLANLVQVL